MEPVTNLLVPSTDPDDRKPIYEIQVYDEFDRIIKTCTFFDRDLDSVSRIFYDMGDTHCFANRNVSLALYRIDKIDFISRSINND